MDNLDTELYKLYRVYTPVQVPDEQLEFPFMYEDTTDPEFWLEIK